MNVLLALLALAAVRCGAAARAKPRLTLADAPDALKVAEAAALLGISEGLCRREIAAGRIPAVWFGRIVRVPKVAVERLLEGEQ